MSVPAPTVEPGYTTTEFWVTQITAFLGLLVAFNVVHLTATQTQTLIGFASSTIAEAAYAISRAIRKSGTTG